MEEERVAEFDESGYAGLIKTIKADKIEGRTTQEKEPMVLNTTQLGEI